MREDSALPGYSWHGVFDSYRLSVLCDSVADDAICVSKKSEELLFFCVGSRQSDSFPARILARNSGIQCPKLFVIRLEPELSSIVDSCNGTHSYHWPAR